MNKMSTHPPIETMRHSCAHLMACAVQRLWPNAIFGVGPATATGFFYDIGLEASIGPEELDQIEEEMRRIVAADEPFVSESLPIEDAISLMVRLHQPLKVELLEQLRDKGTTAVLDDLEDSSLLDGSSVDAVTVYRCAGFTDLCRGPHVSTTTDIGAFKLASVSGAFWRGDSRNRQLTRIHGLCFPTLAELKSHIDRLEEQRRRDHRRLNSVLQIFHISDEVGSGLPLWLPNGTILREEVEFLAKREEWRRGYQRVTTPAITHERLYYRSGHLPYYKDDMYAPLEIDGERFYLRPMNCPHHHQIFAARNRSYRELPLRLAEYGTVYRYERSGVLSGLMRSRGFTQNDAHIYCRYDQALAECMSILEMHAEYYRLFDITEYEVVLAMPDERRGDKYVAAPQEWLDAVDVLREALVRTKTQYREAKGEAAFYGPKIDFIIKNAVGTEYAISTAQLDFAASARFDLKYVDESGQMKPVYVIHRAPLGSHERFIAFLIEHYAGRFPVWLAPVQARLIPIADRHLEHAQRIAAVLRSTAVENVNGGIRADIDDSKERMQKKIRAAQLQHVPYMLLVGDKEVETGTVSVRHRSKGDLGSLPVADICRRITVEIGTRRDERSPDAAQSADAS